MRRVKSGTDEGNTIVVTRNYRTAPDARRAVIFAWRIFLRLAKRLL
jgi:hypothetical protein